MIQLGYDAARLYCIPTQRVGTRGRAWEREGARGNERVRVGTRGRAWEREGVRGNERERID